MSLINLLDETTINQIAAGEVVERPGAVVKELVENAVDAQASSITVEIKDGGLSLIRITDNGAGISEGDIPTAFMRHATSKIRSAMDLLSVTSLGFRGEALSSIASIAQVELLTKTSESLSGSRYIIEGGNEKGLEGIGCPRGTTIIVRNLFYNTPARRNFIKSKTSEATHIGSLMERLMLSHPNISFKFINNGKTRLQSSGNNNPKDVLYNIYGREVVKDLLDLNYDGDSLKVKGYIGKPAISRGNRTYINYFINGRYIRNETITKAIIDAYKPYVMQHKFPFTSLYFEINPEFIDVNVHPQKLEMRLTNGDEIYTIIYDELTKALSKREMIPSVSLGKEQKSKKVLNKSDIMPEPFEYERKKEFKTRNITSDIVFKELESAEKHDGKQMEIFAEDTSAFLSREAFDGHKIIGQVFSTYWLIEYDKKLYIIDQHAAHEKVMFEKILYKANKKESLSQNLFPPIVLTLSLNEVETIEKYKENLEEIGYTFEHFGGNEYSVRTVPSDLYNLSEKNLLLEFIDELGNENPVNSSPQIIQEKIASLSCKAAVKGNHIFSLDEGRALIKELLILDNPYYCPHGRPVITSLTQYELEKMFKRIV